MHEVSQSHRQYIVSFHHTSVLNVQGQLQRSSQRPQWIYCGEIKRIEVKCSLFQENRSNSGYLKKVKSQKWKQKTRAVFQALRLSGFLRIWLTLRSRGVITASGFCSVSPRGYHVAAESSIWGKALLKSISFGNVKMDREVLPTPLIRVKGILVVCSNEFCDFRWVPCGLSFPSPTMKDLNRWSWNSLLTLECLILWSSCSVISAVATVPGKYWGTRWWVL